MIETKVCSRCKRENTLADMVRHRYSRDGHGSICRACAREQSRAWRLANPALAAEVSRKSAQRVRERYRARTDAEIAADQARLRPGGVKRCSGCKQTLPLSAFRRSRVQADGLQTSCTECMRSYQAAQRLANPALAAEVSRKNMRRIRERYRARTDAEIEADQARLHPGGVKRCPRCEQALPLSAFRRSRAQADGLQTYCTECTRSYQAAQRRANPVRAAEVSRKSMRRVRERYRARTDAEIAADQARLHPGGVKRCPRCEQVLPLSAFQRSRAQADGLQPYCAECVRSYLAQHRARA